MFHMQSLFNQGKSAPITGKENHIIKFHLILTKAHEKQQQQTHTSVIQT